MRAEGCGTTCATAGSWSRSTSVRILLSWHGAPQFACVHLSLTRTHVASQRPAAVVFAVYRQLHVSLSYIRRARPWRSSASLRYVLWRGMCCALLRLHLYTCGVCSHPNCSGGGTVQPWRRTSSRFVCCSLTKPLLTPSSAPHATNDAVCRCALHATWCVIGLQDGGAAAGPSPCVAVVHGTAGTLPLLAYGELARMPPAAP